MAIIVNKVYWVIFSPEFERRIEKIFLFSDHSLLFRRLNQGFSQKAVQPSYGRPFLEETQGKFT